MNGERKQSLGGKAAKRFYRVDSQSDLSRWENTVFRYISAWLVINTGTGTMEPTSATTIGGVSSVLGKWLTRLEGFTQL